MWVATRPSGTSPSTATWSLGPTSLGNLERWGTNLNMRNGTTKADFENLKVSSEILARLGNGHVRHPRASRAHRTALRPPSYRPRAASLPRRAGPRPEFRPRPVDRLCVGRLADALRTGRRGTGHRLVNASCTIINRTLTAGVRSGPPDIRALRYDSLAWRASSAPSVVLLNTMVRKSNGALTGDSAWSTCTHTSRLVDRGRSHMIFSSIPRRARSNFTPLPNGGEHSAVTHFKHAMEALPLF